MTNTFFLSVASSIVSSSTLGFTVHPIRLPIMIPVKQRPHPIHGRMSSTFPSNALFANSLSHKFGRPIIHMSHFPLAISSSAIHGSLIRATVATGIFTCFLISSLE